MLNGVIPWAESFVEREKGPRRLDPKRIERWKTPIHGFLSPLALGSCLGGCDILGLGDREFIISVDSISVPETVLAEDSIPVRVFGWVGPDGCHRFSHFEVKKTPNRARITVRGLESNSGDCTAAPVSSDRVNVIRPPLSDPFTVVVNQPKNEDLEQLVRVQ